MSDGSTKPVPSGASLAIRSFFGWWIGELTALVPDSWKVSRQSARAAILFCPRDTDFLIISRDNGSTREIGGVGANQEGAANAIESVLAGAGLRREDARLGLLLPENLVLTKTVEMPLAAEKELRSILGHQMDRMTPYQGDQVYFGFQVMTRDRTKRRLTVKVALAARDAVDEALDALRRLGVSPDFADYGSVDSGPAGFDLLARPGSMVPPGGHGANRWLAAVNAALLAAVLLLPIGQKALYRSALREEVAETRTQAQASAQLRAEVDKLRSEASFLYEKKQAAPPIVAVIDELSRVIPDGTWLSRLTVKASALQIQGYSDRAASLIGAIENSPVFENVNFSAAVTRAARVGADQFQLSAEVSAGDNND